MKKYFYALIVFFMFIPFVSAKETVVYLFHSDTCPHCKEERAYLSTIKDENIKIKYYEVSKYSNLYEKVKKRLGISENSVPITIVGTDYEIGYSSDMKGTIDNLIYSYKDKDYCDAVQLIIDNKNQDKINACIVKNKGIYDIENQVDKKISFLGKTLEFNAKSVSLPLISIIIGFIDGFNPCATWVLIFLITMLFNMQDRRKMWILGITFLITSGLIYLVFMLGLLTITNSLISTYFKYVIASVALIGGIVNLISFKKSLKEDTGCQVTDKKKRLKIIDRIKKIVTEKHLLISIIGIMFLAISVNFVELLCSSGLPTVFISILSLNDLNNIQYFIYMALYIIMFMIDDIIIFIIAMKTFKITGISNKYTKYSHLIGGLIMLVIGLLMLFKMDWLMFNF